MTVRTQHKEILHFLLVVFYAQGLRNSKNEDCDLWIEKFASRSSEELPLFLWYLIPISLIIHSIVNPMAHFNC
jgi:hypothetical protein